MKTKEVKVSELSGYALDWAVGKRAEGLKITTLGSGHTHGIWLVSGESWYTNYKAYHPSTEWEQGGPIIERIRGLYVKHWIESSYDTRYEVHIHNSEEDSIGFGETLLIASMRCYIASRLGDTVSVPVELLEV